MGTWNSTAFAGRRTWARWSRSYGFPLRVAGCFVFVALATAFVGFETDAILIWVANGLMLSYLLLAPRWRWPAYLFAGFAGQLVAGQLVYPHIGTNLLMSLLNVTEVFSSAWLLRRHSNQLPRFTDIKYLSRFICIAALAVPLLAGVLFALLSGSTFHKAPLRLFVEWVASDGLGAAVSTPVFVAIFMSRFRGRVNWRRNWVYPALFALVSIASFTQVKVPVLFLYYPLLILILMRMGLAWAAMGSLFAAGVGTRMTLAGLGPFAAANGFAPGEAGILLQTYIAAGMFMVYTVSVVMENRKASEKRLQEIVAQYALVTENSRDAIVISDFAGLQRYFSPAVKNLTGWESKEFAKRRLRDTVHPDDLARVEKTLTDLRSGEETAQIEYRFQKPNGECVWVETNMMVFRDPVTGKPAGLLDFIRDITRRKLAEQSREFHHSLIRAIHEVSPAGILVVDDAGDVVSINRRFAEVWKVSKPDMPASLHDRVVAPDEQLLAQCVDLTKDPEGFLKRIQELYADRDATDQCLIELKDGGTLERYTTSLRGEGGQYLGRVWFFTDITERKHAEEELQRAYKTVEALSALDSLTGLANRRRFDDYLAIEWRRAMREGRPISLLLVDVDHFKSYNDTYGHLCGDACLRKIAESTLDSVKRAGDLVARFGGDEFTVILTDTSSDGALGVANDICESVRSCKLPHEANATGVVTASIGCASMRPKLGGDAATLIDLADRALYSAKRAGRNMVYRGDGANGE